jgi:hypothetical protein
MNHQLDAPFSEEEIKAAIDDLPAKKALGLGGFTGMFNRTCWEVIKPELIVAF